MFEGDAVSLLAASLGAMALAAAVFAIMYPYISGERTKDKRIQVVTESHGKKIAKLSAAEAAAHRRKAVADTLKDIESRKKAKEKLTVRLLLQRAGLDLTPRNFWMMSAASGVGLALLTYLSLPHSFLSLVVVIVAAFVGAFGLPRWMLKRMVNRRQYKFQRELANAVDVIVRGVKAGLPLNECLGIISRESAEPVASEFRDVVEQQRVGVPLGEALEKMVQRMPVAEVKFLAIVVAIQQQAGGNLSEALENLSNVLRDRFKLQMKVKALSAEAKASASVLSSLPPGVMIILNFASPEYMVPLYSTKTGYFLILICIMWMGMGVLVMRKMINFKF